MPRGIYDRSKFKKKTKEAKAEKKPRKYGNRWTKAKEVAGAGAVSAKPGTALVPQSLIDYSLLQYFQSLVGARTVVSGMNAALAGKLDSELSEVLDELKRARKHSSASPSVIPKAQTPKERKENGTGEQAPAPVPFNTPAQA